MKLYYKMLLAVGMILAIGTANASTSLNVVKKDGTSQVLSVEDDGKVYFENGTLLVQTQATATAQAFPLSSVRKILFSSSTNSVKNALAEGEVVITPNPVSEVMYLIGLDEQSEVSVYSLGGALMLSTAYSVSEGVSLASLPAGFYIVKADGKTYKVCKL